MHNSFEQSNKTHRNIYIALLVAQGVIIGILERMIPFPFAFAPVPNWDWLTSLRSSPSTRFRYEMSSP